MLIWLRQFLFHIATWAKKLHVDVYYPFWKPFMPFSSFYHYISSTTHLVYVHSLHLCHGLVEQHFHIKMGWFWRLILLGYSIGLVYWRNCELILCFPCHLHFPLKEKNREKRCWKREKKSKDNKRKARNREVVNKVVGMGLWQ